MNRLRHEAGQTVVLFAILLPLLLGLGAIAVDVGYWYVVKKTAQDAADAAALAAAAELPDRSAAEDAAETYVDANLPGASWTVEYPYVPDTGGSGGLPGVQPPEAAPGAQDPTRIEVIVEYEVRTFFGQVFGVLEAAVSGRAVAERPVSAGNLAIFSHNYHGCADGLEIDAAALRVDGLVHSNGQYDVHSGSPPDDFRAADGTIWRENCVSNLDPEPYGALYGPGPDFLPRDVFRMANWPAWYTPANFGWPACSFSGRRIEVLANQVKVTDPDLTLPYTGRIPTGTYCATEAFVISASNRAGTITALAPVIATEGSHLNLGPASDGVLFFAVPNVSNADDGSLGAGGNPSCVPSSGNDMQLNGDQQVWRGVIFNPCGRINLNVGESAIEGAVIGNMVKVTGGRLHLTGTGTFAAPVGLVE